MNLNEPEPIEDHEAVQATVRVTGHGAGLFLLTTDDSRLAIHMPRIVLEDIQRQIEVALATMPPARPGTGQLPRARLP